MDWELIKDRVNQVVKLQSRLDAQQAERQDLQSQITALDLALKTGQAELRQAKQEVKDMIAKNGG